MAEPVPDQPNPPTGGQPQPSIYTGGGSVVHGDVDTKGGDFVGRDKVIYIGSVKVPRWLVYSAIVVLAAVVTAQAANLWGIQSVQQTLNQPTEAPPPTVAPTPTPSPTPQRMNSPVFNLAVAQFGEQNAAGAVVSSQSGRDLSAWLASRLQRELQGEEVVANLGAMLVWHDDLNLPQGNPPIGLIQSEADAANLVQAIGATMVISGVLVGSPDEPELRLGFYYASPVLRDTPDAAQGQYLLGSPLLIEFAQDPVLMREAQESNPELVQRSTLLVWLVKALAREVVRKPMQALDLFQQAEGRLAGWDNRGAKSVFYYFMGRTALLVQDLPEARRTLEQAVAENPENAPAHIALGNFYYTLAQLYYARQQPLVETVARCAADFSNAGVDVNALAAASTEIPVEAAAVEEALARALGYYQTARDLASRQGPELVDVANLMSASAYRLAGEGQLYRFDQQSAAGEPALALLEQARTALSEAERLYSATTAPFKASRRFGFLAYAFNGLGLTKRAQAHLARLEADVDLAKEDYAAAIDHFRACSALRDQKDRNEDKELQTKMDCFCSFYNDTVEQEYISIGGGEG